jgi:hypothetical protein
MKKEELIKEIIFKTLKDASGLSIQFYEPECDEELDIEQRKYIGSVFSQFIERANKVLLQQIYRKREQDRLSILLYYYAYCTEKAIEVTYNLRKGLNKEIKFDGEAIGTGYIGDDLTFGVQMQLAPILDRFEVLIEEVYSDMIDDKLLTAKTRPYAYEAILWGAVYLGVELCLRMNLDD